MASSEEKKLSLGKSKREKEDDELEKLIAKANNDEHVPVWDLIMQNGVTKQGTNKRAVKLLAGDMQLSEFVKSQVKAKPGGVSDESDHLYWKREDMYGKYQARKIRAYMPIPGMVIEDWQQRVDGRKKMKDELMERRAKEAVEREDHAKHRRYMQANIMPYTEGGRNIKRLLGQIDEASRDLHVAHNKAYTTDKRHLVEAHDIPDIRFKDVELKDFKHGIIPKKHLEELEDRLWKMYQPPKDRDVVGIEAVSGTEKKPYILQRQHGTRLTQKYGGQYRRKTVASLTARKKHRVKVQKLGAKAALVFNRTGKLAAKNREMNQLNDTHAELHEL